MQQHGAEYGDSCLNVVYQTVDVGLPISLSPCVHLGNAKILCCGEARVECCESSGACGGLELKITQTVTYKVPIEYRVEATPGDVTSVCKKSGSNASCTHCRY